MPSHFARMVDGRRTMNRLQSDSDRRVQHSLARRRERAAHRGLDDRVCELVLRVGFRAVLDQCPPTAEHVNRVGQCECIKS